MDDLPVNSCNLLTFNALEWGIRKIVVRDMPPKVLTHSPDAYDSSLVQVAVTPRFACQIRANNSGG